MKKGCCKSIWNALKQIQKKKLFGFTLVELLIAILIIGVLTAMALPMYQKSVDKSRYATLMPLAKNIKDAQEAFYLGGGKYSKDLGSLDVRVPGNPSGNTATLSDGTTVEISTTDGYGYVKLSKNNLNNNYIVYQDRSQNYPGEIHCEALTDSDRANELCQNLGGTKISGSLTEGYTTYILSGIGAGVSPDFNDVINDVINENSHWQSCDSYPCEKTCDRPMKAGFTCTGTYNQDKTYAEQICDGTVCVTLEHGAKGNTTKKTLCIQQEGSCEWYAEKIWDEAGRLLEYNYCQNDEMMGSSCASITKNSYIYNEDGYTQQTCYQWEGQNTCGWGTEQTYNSQGKEVVTKNCYSYSEDDMCLQYDSGTYYTYDTDGNMLSKKNCTAFDAGGDCTSYSSGEFDTYENGHRTSAVECSTLSSDGTTCESYKSGGWFGGYDENGNQTYYRYCTDNYNSDGTCAQWRSGGYSVYEDGKLKASLTCSGASSGYNSDGSCGSYSFGTFYEYDENGNQIRKSDCYTVNSDGTCASGGGVRTWTYDGNKVTEVYSSPSTYDYDQYLYDENGNLLYRIGCGVASRTPCTKYTGTYSTYDNDGNKTSSRYCTSANSDGTCAAYSTSSGQNIDYTYDKNGRVSAQLYCSSVNSDGTCAAYTRGAYYMYDSNGRQQAELSCSTINEDRSCAAYGSGTYYQYDESGNEHYTSCSSVSSDGSSCLAYSSRDEGVSGEDDGSVLWYYQCSWYGSDGTCERDRSGYSL